MKVQTYTSTNKGFPYTFPIVFGEQVIIKRALFPTEFSSPLYKSSLTVSPPDRELTVKLNKNRYTVVRS